MSNNSKYQDLAPDDLKGYFMLAEPHEEFIVGIDFSYCEVDYKGFEIVSCKNLGALIYGLEIDEEIATRNMPKHWEETFSIGQLEGSFKIHSSDPSDVDAMRALFGESVGEVSYFEAVWQKFRDYWQDACETDVKAFDAKVILEHADEYIFDTNCIEKFVTIEAVELFSKQEGDLSLNGLTELTDAAAELLSKHQNYLSLNGLTELSDAAAESLSKHHGDLRLDGLTELSDAAAESLSKHQAELGLNGLTELSDAATESLSKHQGGLELGGLTELSDAAAESLSKHQGQGSLGLDGLTELKIAPGVKMTFCWCPPGDFLMGSPETEEGRYDNEDQVHVTLTKGFWMAKTEVTQAQWRAVMGNNPSHFKGDDLPVENVSWDDAQEFIKKVNGSGEIPEGGKVCLPTEAQWEYACRAGEKGPYSGGSLDQVAWYDENSGDKTHPVGRKKSNAWGLHDMHGNVWEWCADWHDDSLRGGTDPSGPSSGVIRVSRGGSWYDAAACCRAAFRGERDPDFWDSYQGFRPALVPSE